MSRSFFFCLLSLAFFLFASLNAACSRGSSGEEPPAPAAGFRTVTPAEAMQIIRTRKNLLILDVRSPQELREGAIANSMLVPIWQIRSLRPDPNRPVLVYCAVGGRSYMAGQYLYRSGVKEVYNIQGGIAAWKKAGLPVVYPRT